MAYMDTGLKILTKYSTGKRLNMMVYMNTSIK